MSEIRSGEKQEFILYVIFPSVYYTPWFGDYILSLLSCAIYAKMYVRTFQDDTSFKNDISS